MDLLKIFLIISLLFFPLGQLARLQFGNAVVLLPNDILVGLVFVFWLIRLIFKREIPKGRVFKVLCIFILIGLTSLILNTRFLNQQEFFVSFLYLLRFAAYAILYFVVEKLDVNSKKKIIFLLFFVGLVIIFGGYIQYFFYNNLRNLYYLGWDEHLHRMFSSFLDPNFAGAFFVLYFLFVLGFVIGNKELIKKNKTKLIITYLVLILTLISIYLTYSRSALIMLFVSLGIFLLIKRRAKWIFGVILIFLAVFIVSSRNFYIENLNLLRVVSSEARIKSAIDAIKIIKKQPILGVGFNAYRYAQIRYGTRSGLGAINSHADAGTDNSFLFVLATTGIVGFISYMYLWFTLLKRLGRNKIVRDKTTAWLKPVLISSSLALFIDSLFINSLFYPLIMMWMWIVLGLKDCS